MIDEVIKYWNGAKWFLLYQQHYKKGLFQNINPLFNLEEGRFSLLSQIKDKYKIDGSYEFLYEDPSLDLYIRWRQSKNPLEINETTDKIDGFYLFPDSTMKTASSDCTFNGLARSNTPYSLLDGCRFSARWNWAVVVFDSTEVNKMLPTNVWTEEIVL